MDAREVTKDLEISSFPKEYSLEKVSLKKVFAIICGPTRALIQNRVFFAAPLEDLGVGVGIRMESDFAHGMGNLPVLHEALPYKAAAQVFCH